MASNFKVSGTDVEQVFVPREYTFADYVYPSELWSWGNNTSGVLGHSNITTYSSPKQVGNSYWRTVDVGPTYSIGVRSEIDLSDPYNNNRGRPYTWGAFGSGALGLTTNADRSQPTALSATNDWSKVAIGGESWMLAIKQNGTLWGWGYNYNYSQIGLNDTTTYSSPVQVGTSTDWADVACGFYHSIALKTDGTLWTWGFNDYGQCGHANVSLYRSPRQVGSSQWKKVVGGYYHSLGIRSDGTLWAWGFNSNGALGQNNLTQYSSPVQVGYENNWVDIAAGNEKSMAVNSAGALYTWGQNTYGDLGHANTTTYSSPRRVGALSNWLRPEVGQDNTYAIKTDGTLWAVGGRNQYGQLGQNNTTNYSSPRQIGTDTNWNTVKAFNESVLALKGSIS